MRALEARYMRYLRARNRRVRAALLEAAGLSIKGGVVRMDAEQVEGQVLDRLRAAIASLRLRVSALGDIDAAQLAELAAATDEMATARFAASMRAAITLDWRDIGLADAQLRAWVRENVALIKTIDERYFADVEAVTQQALLSGRNTRDLAADLGRRFEVSDSRAELIARDQIAKLNGAITEHRQRQYGVDRYRWSTSGDERVRPSHEALDGQVFTWDAPPSVGHPGQDFQCVPASSAVSIPGRPIAMFRRVHHGKMVSIKTSSGRTIQCTPNHPVLTSRGWIPAGSVKHGDHLVVAGIQGAPGVAGDEDHVVPSAEQVFDLLLELGSEIVGSDGSDVQFHGDGSAYEKVDVVPVDARLWVNLVSKLNERGQDPILSVPDSSALRGGAGRDPGITPRASGRDVCLPGQAGPFICGQLGHPGEHSFRPTPRAELGTLQDSDDRGSGDAKPGCDCFDALPSGELGQDYGLVKLDPVVCRTLGLDVGVPSGSEGGGQVVWIAADGPGGLGEAEPASDQLDRVVDVALDPAWSGHVYNLWTVANWYVTNGVIVHNCRCIAEPVLDNEDAAQTAADAHARMVRESEWLSQSAVASGDITPNKRKLTAERRRQFVDQYRSVTAASAKV